MITIVHAYAATMWLWRNNRNCSAIQGILGNNLTHTILRLSNRDMILVLTKISNEIISMYDLQSWTNRLRWYIKQAQSNIPRWVNKKNSMFYFNLI